MIVTHVNLLLLFLLFSLLCVNVVIRVLRAALTKIQFVVCIYEFVHENNPSHNVVLISHKIGTHALLVLLMAMMSIDRRMNGWLFWILRRLLVGWRFANCVCYFFRSLVCCCCCCFPFYDRWTEPHYLFCVLSLRT